MTPTDNADPEDGDARRKASEVPDQSRPGKSDAKSGDAKQADVDHVNAEQVDTDDDSDVDDPDDWEDDFDVEDDGLDDINAQSTEAVAGDAAEIGPGAADAGKRPRRRRKRKPVVERKKLSTILQEIAVDPVRDRVSVEDLVRVMDGRAFGALLLIFAFPNALPTPPGTSGILGLPLLYLSAQMMLRRAPWLPKFIGGRSMARSDFGALVERVNPWLTWADRFMAPRLQFFVAPRAEMLLGAFVLLLASVLVLPIPLGNMLPALAICLIALGILENDGLWILMGIGVGSVALVIVMTVVWALVRAAVFLLLNAF